MIKYINKDNIEALSVGAALLGSGGGGDPGYYLEIAKYLLGDDKQIKVLRLSDLNKDDLVLPVGSVGAPLVNKEKLPNHLEFETLLAAFKKYYGDAPSAIMPGEIGGANGLFPIIMSCITGIPVIDGDLMGRAFPGLHMTSCYLKNIPCAPAFLADKNGNSVTLNISDAKGIEDVARAIIVKCSSSMIVGLYCMNLIQLNKALVRDTISYAINLGNSILGRKNVLENLCELTQGKVIFTGIIKDISQTIVDGFLVGEVLIEDHKQLCKVIFKNEYLAAYESGDLIAETPDIIAILDDENFSPITAENLVYGIKVSLLTFKADPIWYSKEALEIVGLDAFNLGRSIK